MYMFDGRQGQMCLNQVYFYTQTIHDFYPLLSDDKLKQVIVDSLHFLTQKRLVEIYGYVIMPNHIHLIWNILQMNAKESPSGSFSKFTAHEFKRYLQSCNPLLLGRFASEKQDRNFQFWKRDPLAISISNETILLQKLDYIHNNPLNSKWGLCQYPEDYKWSSARYYNTGEDEFGILKDFRGDFVSAGEDTDR